MNGKLGVRAWCGSTVVAKLRCSPGRSIYLCLLALCCGLQIGVSLAAAGEFETQFVLKAGMFDRPAGPVHCATHFPDSFAGNESTATVITPDGQSFYGQLVRPSVLSKTADGRPGNWELIWIAPPLKAKEELKFRVEWETPRRDRVATYRWLDSDGKQAELQFDGRPVLRYMHEPLDESSAERRGETYKPYHHVFDPLGKQLVTKGPGGLFPHHRGLFFGFNRIQYAEGTKKADTWHCNNGEFQSHERTLSAESGPILGRHRTQIAWHGQDGGIFAQEEREMSAIRLPGGSLIEFASRLTSTAGKVRLDGDPQHAGFQFRAAQEVPDKTAMQTYYLRPDGKGEPGKFRNWDDKGRDPQTINLPWLGLSFVLGQTRFTCLYLDRPENPKEARYSERDYGRFGSYFEYDLDTGHPLELRYRIWLQEGEMSVIEAQAMADHFAFPPECVAAK